jgi:hypothetical protein
MSPEANIPGYNYGHAEIPKSPVSLEELEQLKQTVGLTDKDIRLLNAAGKILESQTGEIAGKWRGLIGEQPHLARYFFEANGKPDEQYKARAGYRLQQWIIDVCRRPLDQDWLNYQHEIGLRHTHVKKNKADGAATPPHIPLRYLIAFTAVVNDTVKPFLASRGATPETVEAMHRAWCKSVLLHLTLWTRAYVAESDW